MKSSFYLADLARILQDLTNARKRTFSCKNVQVLQDTLARSFLLGRKLLWNCVYIDYRGTLVDSLYINHSSDQDLALLSRKKMPSMAPYHIWEAKVLNLVLTQNGKLAIPYTTPFHTSCVILLYWSKGNSRKGHNMHSFCINSGVAVAICNVARISDIRIHMLEKQWIDTSQTYIITPPMT